MIESAEKEEATLYDLANLVKCITGGSNVDEDKIVEWFERDVDNPGFGHLMDEQLGGALSIWFRRKVGKKNQKQVNYEPAIAYIGGFVLYLEEDE